MAIEAFPPDFGEGSPWELISEITAQTRDIVRDGLHRVAATLGLRHTHDTLETGIVFNGSGDEPAEPPIEGVQGISQQWGDAQNRDQTNREAANSPAAQAAQANAENKAFNAQNTRESGGVVDGRKKKK